MGKNKRVQSVYVPTKRHISRLEKQRKQNRLIKMVGGVIVGAVALTVAVALLFGWYIPDVAPLGKTVLEVNGEEFDMGYYLDSLNYYTGGQAAAAPDYYQDLVVEVIKEGALIRQEAANLGYTVSKDEIDTLIEEAGASNKQAIRDIAETQLLLQMIEEGVIDPTVPFSGPQKELMVMFLESESQAEEIRQRLADGEDFADLASDYSLDSITEEDDGVLGWKPESIVESLLGTGLLSEYISGAEAGGISHPIFDEGKGKAIGYWLVEVVEFDEDTGEAHIRVMLLNSEEEVNSVKARLEAGEDFGELAAELSQKVGASDDLGDLGFVTMADIETAVFYDFVFGEDAVAGVLSQPFADEDQTTTGGYWLVMVNGVDADREYAEDDREALVNLAMSDWQDVLFDDPKHDITIYLDDEMREFITTRDIS